MKEAEKMMKDPSFQKEMKKMSNSKVRTDQTRNSFYLPMR